MADNVFWLDNGTAEDVRVAILAKWEKYSSIADFAWKIVPLPVRTPQRVVVPEACEFVANHGNSEDPWGGSPSNSVRVMAGARKIAAVGENHPQMGYTMHVSITGISDLGTSVEVGNQTDRGIWLHTMKGGIDVISPVPVAPGRAFIVDPFFDYWVVVVGKDAREGRPLGEDSVRPKPIRVKFGQTAMLTGPFRDGYVFDGYDA